MVTSAAVSNSSGLLRGLPSLGGRRARMVVLEEEVGRPEEHRY